jgi:hypothetical protein
MVLPLFSPPSALSRLTSIFLGFAPPFLLLSIGYAVTFCSSHTFFVCTVPEVLEHENSISYFVKPLQL